MPWLLLEADDMQHVGTIDIDLTLDAEALGDGEYVRLVEALMGNGYAQSAEHRRFQLVRTIEVADGGPPVDVIVDFLMPRDAEIEKNIPPLLSEFAVQRASGAELAVRFHRLTAIEGTMPGGGHNRVKIAVASIPALLAMKGHALMRRQKRKDAYDVYYCIRNYEGGPQALAEVCRPLLDIKDAREGYLGIAEKFAKENMIGPVWVRQFVEGTLYIGDRTPEQWQADAFGQVHAWMIALGLAD
ncbi:nucleotidyl transferase AbiEii/AbiGii toxin family protein [Mesorhizobium sp.]|uniref:nucleotidyl transferase AbiEii/AbiGii toxin family protein n=1 Tax=Mesorhizobium sp. TaxID=1871066 RepID=UPI0025F9484D|nr:nucleotidyl transferase AbiEii/AbiGii toxin family protein [Mesorhizobium sp.]